MLVLQMYQYIVRYRSEFVTTMEIVVSDTFM